MKLNRTLYRILLILSFLVVNMLILAGINALFSYLNTGADRSSILHLPGESSTSYVPSLKWSPLQNEGRPIENQTLKEIERDYLKAWEIRNIALQTNEIQGIADYYTDSARVKLIDIIEFNKRNAIHFKTTTLKHHPKLEFYSADGKIAVLTDEHVATYEEAYFNNYRIAKKRDAASYQVMLLLEDGFWRIRHMVKHSSKSNQNVAADNFDRVTVDHIRGINYYPQKTPWNMYGDNFNDSIVNNDFKKIKTMGLNTVRVFIPFEAFGKTKIDTKKLDQLKYILELATKNDLKVIVTLFDFYGDYSVQNWTVTHRHAEQFVMGLKDHEALLAWDIKNEPDLDFDSRGKEEVKAWLHEMILQIKSWDNEHPITIGWSSPEAAQHLSTEVDFVSFHYYREPDVFLEAVKELKTAVSDKPIVLQEYGYSSYNGIWNAYSNSEDDQAHYYREMQKIIKSESIPYLFWTLYDFESVPNSVVGKLPWRKEKQRHFGLIDNDGEPKEAYQLLIAPKK